MANLKMVTGRLAMGPRRSSVQNWFDSAVNNSGAVSPEMRASASSTPVMTPTRAAFSVTDEITFHFGVPQDAEMGLPGDEQMSLEAAPADAAAPADGTPTA